MSRSEQLHNSVAAFLQAHRDWVAVDTDITRPDIPPASWWEACEAMFDLWQVGEVPEDCRLLAEEVEKFEVAVHEWDLLERPDLSEDLKRARESLEAAFERGNIPEDDRPVLEPMALLAKQDVSYEQIARMYGLVDSSGKGKAHLVAKELANPGSVIKADWVHPDELERRQALENATKRSRAVRESVGEESPRKQAEPDPPCPETVEDLYYQEVSVEQAARMLQRPVEDVAADYEAFKRRDRPGLAAVNLFADWSDDEIREEAKRRGIQTRGRQSRETLIRKISETMVQHVGPVEGSESE